MNENYKVIRFNTGKDRFFVIYTLTELNIQEGQDESYSCDINVCIHMVIPLAFPIVGNYSMEQILATAEYAIIAHEEGAPIDDKAIKRVSHNIIKFNKDLH